MRLPAAFERALPASDWPDLARAGVLVALADLRPWTPWLQEAWTVLDPEQRQRASRQHRASDREGLALSYALHRLLLGRVLGLPPERVPLVRDELGCPRITGAPAHTSLGHAGGWAAIAVSIQGPVGVDLEPVARAPELPGIAHLVCHPSESRQLAALPADERPRWLLATWVRKEALLKAEGVGLTREMSTFAAPPGTTIASSVSPGSGLQANMLELDPSCTIAVAATTGSAIHPARLDPRG